jgi:hypothetical protein
MRRNGKLSRVERLLAAVLSIVWLAGGVIALDIALTRARWAMAVAASLAIGFGVVWLCVAARSRLFAVSAR